MNRLDCEPQMMAAQPAPQQAAASAPLPGTPQVSVGMPVYNAARYLRQAIESVLAQTWKDLELVISDNASTDATAEICGEYAARDARVRYFRCGHNHGITWNFRQVVQRARGEFFMWLAHDDVLAPEYIEHCLRAMQRDRSLVLCYSAALDLDEAGRRSIHHELPGAHSASAAAHIRFRDLIRMNHMCEPLFGLIRTEVLRKTPVHADFPDSDRCLLAELALYGPFHRIAEPLFYHREHADRATRQYVSRQARLASIHPGRQAGLALPYFRQFAEYLAAIARASLPRRERLRCYLQMLPWLRTNAGRLLNDLKFVAYQLYRRVRALFDAR